MRPVSMNSKTKIAEEEEEELEAAVSLFLSPSLSLSLAGVLCIQKPVGTESKSSIIMSWSCCWFSTLALSLSFGGNSHMWRTRIYNSQNKASVWFISPIVVAASSLTLRCCWLSRALYLGLSATVSPSHTHRHTHATPNAFGVIYVYMYAFFFISAYVILAILSISLSRFLREKTSCTIVTRAQQAKALSDNNNYKLQFLLQTHMGAHHVHTYTAVCVLRSTWYCCCFFEILLFC